MESEVKGLATFFGEMGVIARSFERLCTLARTQLDQAEPPVPQVVVETPVETPMETPVETPMEAPVEAPVNGERKSRPGRVPLTEAQRCGIIAARQREPQPLLIQIAHEFGVSTSSVSNVLARWRVESGQCEPRNPLLQGQQNLPFQEPAAP